MRRLVLALVALQAGIGLYQHRVFLDQMLRFRSRLAEVHAPGAGRSVVVVLALAALSALWAAASRRERSWSERFAAAGLVQIAGLGLAHFSAAIADGGRLHAGLTAPFLLASAALGVLALARSRSTARSAPPRTPRFGLADAGSALFVASLLVTAVFPYIHYDAKLIWACRAFGFENQGSLAAVADCRCPNYPPLYSILLWIGAADPLFAGTLLPWLAFVLFALLFRARAADFAGERAPMALLFLVATVNVWQGAAMYYANVPLMVFLCAGALLAWGPPGGLATAGERAMGAVLVAAAVLIRPDGLVYVGVLALAAALFRAQGGRRVALAPLLAGGAAALLWALRPAAFRAPHDFFADPTSGWLSAGRTPVTAVLEVLVELFDGAQGQWLAHKGFGAAVYLLLGAALLRAFRRRDPAAPPDELRLAGLVAGGSFAAVAACYLGIAFAGDVVEAAQPFSGTWIEAYLHFVRVGLGRMSVHLYPFAVLYAAGVFASEDAAAD